LPPVARIYQLAIGYRISRALQVVTELGIADFLKDGPKSPEELAVPHRVIRTHCFAYSVRTGQPAFDHVFGQEAWQYFSEHPEKSLLLDRAMAAGSGFMGPAIAEAYDFSKFQTIMDVPVL
jgi:hypothetical protein